MMKRIGLALFVTVISFMIYAGEKPDTDPEKVDIDFSSKRIKKYIKRKICFVDADNVLCINGDPSSKLNSWRAVKVALPFKSPAGKSFVFSGEAKAENMQGRLQLSIRLSDSKGNTIKFESTTIYLDQDWKPFTKEFSAPSSTAKMEWMVIARNMGDESIGSVKKLSVKEIKK